MRYLLDTTVLIDHANGFPPATELLERLFAQGAELFTCDVVTCEALSGGTDEHLEVIGRLLEPLEYVSTSPTAARRAGASRLTRHRAEGRLGLGAKPPPQFGQTFSRTLSTQAAQNVHS